MQLSSVSGISDVVKRMHTVKGEFAKGMERGLIKAALHLKRKSQQIVPVDTGALKASAYVKKEGSGFSTDVTVGYGAYVPGFIRSPNLYAMWVHERTDLHHAAGTMAKFLSIPMEEERDKMGDIIREEASKPSGSIPSLPPVYLAEESTGMFRGVGGRFLPPKKGGR